MIQIAKAILISFKDIEEERLFGEIMKTLRKHGIVLQEYEDRKETIEIGDLCLDPTNLCVHQNGKAIEFTYREFFLLYQLAEFSEQCSQKSICMRFYGSNILFQIQQSVRFLH